MDRSSFIESDKLGDHWTRLWPQWWDTFTHQVDLHLDLLRQGQKWYRNQSVKEVIEIVCQNILLHLQLSFLYSSHLSYLRLQRTYNIQIYVMFVPNRCHEQYWNVCLAIFVENVKFADIGSNTENIRTQTSKLPWRKTLTWPNFGQKQKIWTTCICNVEASTFITFGFFRHWSIGVLTTLSQSKAHITSCCILQ